MERKENRWKFSRAAGEKAQPMQLRLFWMPYGASGPVSRVLSFKTAIYLDVPLPTRSSHLLNAAGQACCVTTVLLRIEFTAMSSSQSSGGRLSPPFHPYPPLSPHNIT